MRMILVIALLFAGGAMVPSMAERDAHNVWNWRETPTEVVVGRGAQFWREIRLSCDRQSRQLRIMAHGAFLRPYPASSSELRVKLSSDAGEAGLTMNFVESTYSGHLLTGDTRLTPEWARVLSGRGMLTLHSDVLTVDFPLEGAAEGIQLLIRACGTDG